MSFSTPFCKGYISISISISVDLFRIEWCEFIFTIWHEYVKNEKRIGNIYWNIYLKNDFTFLKMKLVQFYFLVKVSLVKDVFKKSQFISYSFKLFFLFAN